MKFAPSIRPAHNNLKSVNSGFILSDLISDYDESNKAYQDLRSVTSGFVLDNEDSSGYQYLLGSGSSSIYLEPEDDSAITDEVALTVSLNIDEALAVTDSLNIPDTQNVNLSPATDEVDLTVYLNVDEALATTDSGTFAQRNDTFAEPSPVTDDVKITVYINIDEALASVDNVDNFVYISKKYPIRVVNQEYQLRRYTAKVINKEYKNSQYSINTNNAIYDLTSTTNASSIDNVFAPTVVCGGVIYVSNPATYPPGGVTSGTTVYVRVANAGFTGIDNCDIYNYGFNIDNTGGSFNISSVNKPGNLGDEQTLFGLNSVITQVGPFISNSGVGYRTNGIFGTRRLNQQLSVVLFGIPSYNGLVPSQTLQIIGSNNWRTVKDAARAIASVAGTSLVWLCNDAPLTNLLPEVGSSALESLSSLASRVGGKLYWNGVNGFTVAYPDRPIGFWEVPDCCLITDSGIAYQDLLDLQQRDPRGVYILPNIPQSNKGTNNTPQAQGSSPIITELVKTTKLLTTDDPPGVYQLPLNYDKVYIQILIPPGRDTGGSNNGLSIRNFVTADPMEWFEFDVGSLANQYIFKSNIGGAYVPYVKLDSNVFPSNTSVQNGQFVLTLAYSTKSLQPSYDRSKQEREDRIRETLANQQDVYRFVKIYEGTINCIFFGSIPLPGMWAKATVNGTTVEGIVEGVDFTFPGILSIKVAQYAKMTFIQRVLNYGP